MPLLVRMSNRKRLHCAIVDFCSRKSVQNCPDLEAITIIITIINKLTTEGDLSFRNLIALALVRNFILAFNKASVFAFVVALPATDQRQGPYPCSVKDSLI